MGTAKVKKVEKNVAYVTVNISESESEGEGGIVKKGTSTFEAKFTRKGDIYYMNWFFASSFWYVSCKCNIFSFIFNSWDFSWLSHAKSYCFYAFTIYVSLLSFLHAFGLKILTCFGQP